MLVDGIKTQCPVCKNTYDLSEAVRETLKNQFIQEQQEKNQQEYMRIKEAQEEIERKKAELQTLEGEFEKKKDQKIKEATQKLQAKKQEMRDEIKKECEEKYSEFIESLKDLNSEQKEKASLEVQELKDKLKLQMEKLDEAKKVELQLRSKEEDLLAREKDIDLEVARKVDEVKSDAMKQAEEKASLEVQKLKAELEDKDKRIIEAQQKELELLRLQGDLQKQKEEIELEVMRQTINQREEIVKSTEERVIEQHKLQDIEKDRLIESLTVKTEELHRKLQQGSQKEQGTVAEINLQEKLEDAFGREDTMTPIASGKPGHDVTEDVYNDGQLIGRIIWESKSSTKGFDNKWISKIKQDQIKYQADIAVIYTTTLPKGINRFGIINGVYITNTLVAIQVATILRESLKTLNKVKQTAWGSSQKYELLYDYLTGPDFSTKVNAILDTTIDMKKELQSQRDKTIKFYSKQDKMLDIISFNAAEVFGEVQGILGATEDELESEEESEEIACACDDVTKE